MKRPDLATLACVNPACQRFRLTGQDHLPCAKSTARTTSGSCAAGHAMGILLRDLGALPEARTHLEQGIARYDPQQHRSLTFQHGRDPGIIIRYVVAFVLWLLGYPSQALQKSQEAITLAQELGHAYGLAQALCRAADIHLYRREGLAAHARAEATIALATEHGFAQSLACGTIVCGWARVAQGQRETGITQMRQGLAALQATGTEAYWYQALLADAQGQGGLAEAVLTLLAEALTAMEKAGAHGYEAELYRLKGELLLRLAVPDAPQVEAYKLLAPIYGWFTEGFDTADVQEAQALPEALRG